MKKYSILVIALLFAALNFNIILKNLNLVTGGTQGIAIIIEKITNLNTSKIIFIINITSLIISLIFLKKETTTSTIISTFAYPIFVKITSYIPTLIIIRKYKFISSIIAGIICGTTGGLIYKMNFSSGGLTIINLLLKKYLKIKVSKSNFIINTLIIIIGTIYIGINKLIYSLIVVTISSITIHSIMKYNLTRIKN